MNKNEISELVVRVEDLKRRLQILTDDQDKRSLVVHWTDVQTLKDAISSMQDMQNRLNSVEKALHLAYSVVSP